VAIFGIRVREVIEIGIRMLGLGHKVEATHRINGSRYSMLAKCGSSGTPGSVLDRYSIYRLGLSWSIGSSAHVLHVSIRQSSGTGCAGHGR
jgi:hypothetical protein